MCVRGWFGPFRIERQVEQLHPGLVRAQPRNFGRRAAHGERRSRRRRLRDERFVVGDAAAEEWQIGQRGGPRGRRRAGLSRQGPGQRLLVEKRAIGDER